MTLQERLDAMREASKTRIPDYTRRSEPARTVEILAGLRATPSGKERA